MTTTLQLRIDEKLKADALKGEWLGYRECHADIGSHSALFE
jgi:mRNA-degrading endonuclease YafQ of YafQ-DinJ toxin-antitoxin module